MCNCNPNQTDIERYAQQIVIDVPFQEYTKRRKDAGLSGTSCIDPCIVNEIRSLWDAGILTYGCCCGHNKWPSFVNVSDESIPIMLSMGYIQQHPDPERKDTFKLKSV